jgi:hypothetical protein
MKHLNIAHSIYRSACKDHFTHMQLESWYCGPRVKYWVVRTKTAGHKAGPQLPIVE